MNVSMRNIINKIGEVTVDKNKEWFINAHEKKFIYINKYLRDKLID